ncbi:hypothetical protein [Calidifontibacter indicus]|uniref:Lactococcin 972 family bacteriocin n=1 Tax=Calidifontibacter indicus TaxID=419650 RepID=A0A3D9UL13_9MICO|nr:hypothetical protein [Calidifontibacter indicus]REF30026.1 hypothetical protein DFJ65_1017 [Calidifontibacter indicus]
MEVYIVRKKLTKVGIVAAVMMTAASPAFAAYHDAYNNGAGAYNGRGTGSGGWYSGINTTDYRSDERGTRGNYHWADGTGGNLYNGSGNGTTVFRDTSREITAVQACVVYTWNPDDCSTWQ